MVVYRFCLFCQRSLRPKAGFTHRFLRLLPKSWINLSIVPYLFYIIIVFEISKEGIELEYLFFIVYIDKIGR